MKFCPLCRSKNPNEAAVCGFCGESIENVLILPNDWEERRALFAAEFGVDPDGHSQS